MFAIYLLIHIAALAEIDAGFTDQVILLATEKDGQPLPPGEGAFTIHYLRTPILISPAFFLFY